MLLFGHKPSMRRALAKPVAPNAFSVDAGSAVARVTLAQQVAISYQKKSSGVVAKCWGLTWGEGGRGSVEGGGEENAQMDSRLRGNDGCEGGVGRLVVALSCERWR